MHFLIVDTENYAGNFERELVAYATGCYGDCGVGDGEAEDAREDMTHCTAHGRAGPKETDGFYPGVSVFLKKIQKLFF